LDKPILHLTTWGNSSDNVEYLVVITENKRPYYHQYQLFDIETGQLITHFNYLQYSPATEAYVEFNDFNHDGFSELAIFHPSSIGATHGLQIIDGKTKTLWKIPPTGYTTISEILATNDNYVLINNRQYLLNEKGKAKHLSPLCRDRRFDIVEIGPDAAIIQSNRHYIHAEKTHLVSHDISSAQSTYIYHLPTILSALGKASTAFVADVIGNNQYEYATIFPTGSMSLYDDQQQQIGLYLIPRNVIQSAVLDVDNDSFLDILLLTEEGKLYCYATQSQGKAWRGFNNNHRLKKYQIR